MKKMFAVLLALLICALLPISALAETAPLTGSFEREEVTAPKLYGGEEATEGSFEVEEVTAPKLYDEPAAPARISVGLIIAIAVVVVVAAAVVFLLLRKKK